MVDQLHILENQQVELFTAMAFKKGQSHAAWFGALLVFASWLTLWASMEAFLIEYQTFKAQGRE